MVDQLSRRKALELAAGIASTALIAGCSSGGGAEPTEESTDEQTDEPTEASTEESIERTTTEGGSGVDPADWEDVETVRMLGNAGGWIGVEPEMIAEEQNPTIVLFEGNQYEFVWENDDGAGHNVELLDTDGEVVDGYSTEIMREGGATQTLEFEATSEIVEYVCSPHISTMAGDVQVESQ